MWFSAFDKNSFIDYPNKIASLVFSQGCNFACPYCHNPSLISLKTKPKICDEEILSFLKDRKNLIEALVISGGEPTLHNDLMPFLYKVKELGFLIKIDTNGSNPEKIQEYFKNNLIDYIAMDLKSNPNDYIKYFKAPKNIEGKILQSIEIIMQSNIDYEFRTTLSKPFISKEIIENIGQIIKDARAWYFQKCSNIDKVLNPEFFKKENHLFDDKEIKILLKTAKKFVSNTTLR